MSNSDIQIRRIFLKEDAEKIIKLQENAKEFKEHYPRHKEWLKFAIKEIIEGRRYAFGIYKSSFEHYTGQLKIDLIGSIILKREIYTNAFELKNLYIDENYRNKGYGEILFEVVEQFCIKRGGTQIETDVPSVEQNTVKFLSKNKFYVQIHMKSPFKKGDKIYRMIKELPVKYTGDPFDLYNLAVWTIQNIYNFQITRIENDYFDFIHTNKAENNINDNDSISIKGRCIVIDTNEIPDIEYIERNLKVTNVHIHSIVIRRTSKEIQKICNENRILILNFQQLKEQFKSQFSTEFQDFEKENINGMIVPVNFKYYESIKNNHINKVSLTYFKGGPIGKFLKEDDYVLLYFEDATNVYGGIRAYGKIEKCQVGAPDTIWNKFKNENPIFPENEFMSFSSDKSEIVAFKFKDLKFVSRISGSDVTGQKIITPYDNDKLGQYYLNKDNINDFLEIKKEINPNEEEKIENSSLTLNIKEMKITQNFYGDVEKVVNADNFFENNQSVTNEQKNQIIQELTEIKNEKSEAVKENKLSKFIKNWGGTISEVATPIIKELILPK